jgi:hypothetical protein
MPWADDDALLEMIRQPFRPVEHPDPATRRRLASQREELMRRLETEKAKQVATLQRAEATERLVAAAAAGLSGANLNATPFGATVDNIMRRAGAQRFQSEEKPSDDALAVLTRPSRPRRGFVVPALRSDAGDARAEPASIGGGAREGDRALMGDISTRSVDHPASSIEASPREPLRLFGNAPPALALPNAPPGLNPRRPPAVAYNSGGGGPPSVTASPRQNPHGASSASGGGAVSGKSLLQHPAAVPDELVDLLRQFRSAVEVVNAASGARGESEEVKTLSRHSAALARYVTSYFVARETERAAEADAKLRGWVRKPRAGLLTGDSVDPITALLGLTEAAERQHAAAAAAARDGEKHSLGGTLTSRAASSPRGAPGSAAASFRSRSRAQAGGGGGASSVAGGEHQRLTPADPMYRQLCSATLIAVHLLLESVVHLMQCDRATLFLYDESTNELVAAALVGSAGVMRPMRFGPDVGAAGATFRTGISINIPNTDKAPPALFSREMGNRTGYYTRSLLCCPVRTHRGVVRSYADGVMGVVQVVNKLRPANAPFSPVDEDLLNKIGDVIGGMLCAAGEDATFTGSIAIEEGVRAQMLIHSFQQIANLNRSRLATSTMAGSIDLTITEAKALQQQQRNQETRIFAAQREVFGDAPARGREAATGGTGNDRSLLKAVAQSTGPRYSLVYRTPDIAPAASSHGVDKPQELSSIPQDNVRDLVAFLERVEESWKDTRERCLKHEDTIATLSTQLSDTSLAKTRLLRLCIDAGLVDEAEAAAPMNRSVRGGAFDDERDEDLDEPTFLARLAERQSTAVETYEAKRRREQVRLKLQQAAVTRPFDVAAREMRAQEVSHQLANAASLDNLAADPIPRKPLGPETERERRSREYREKRAAAVRAELRVLLQRHQTQQEALLLQQREETARTYQRLMQEDSEAEATLLRVYQQAGGLHPNRHDVLGELERKFAGNP